MGGKSAVILRPPGTQGPPRTMPLIQGIRLHTPEHACPPANTYAQLRAAPQRCSLRRTRICTIAAACCHSFVLHSLTEGQGFMPHGFDRSEHPRAVCSLVKPAEGASTADRGCNRGVSHPSLVQYRAPASRIASRLFPRGNRSHLSHGDPFKGGATSASSLCFRRWRLLPPLRGALNCGTRTTSPVLGLFDLGACKAPRRFPGLFFQAVPVPVPVPVAVCLTAVALVIELPGTVAIHISLFIFTFTFTSFPFSFLCF